MQCVNYQCTSETRKNHVRCPKCRNFGYMTCHDCGINFYNNHKIRCDDCSKKRRIQMNKESYDRRNNKKRECVMCFEKLDKGKTCVGDCKRIYNNLYTQMYIKEHGLR